MDGIEENEQQAQQPETETGPVDLAEAFRMVGKAEQKPADSSVDDAGAEAGEAEPAPAAYDGGEQTADYESLGGSPVDTEDYDIQPARDAILTEIQRNAYSDVASLYKKEGIKTVTIDMLYERDERTGEVSFKNPDNPNRNFTSRAEAQQWCEAFNNQIKDRFKKDVQTKQMELYKQAEPSLRVLAFKDYYDAMDQTTKDIFDDLIDPYSIADRSGKIIGFNCNLEAMARQAYKISQRFQKETPKEEPVQQQAIPKQATKPAMDMKAGASKSNSDFKEPNDIGEALKMFDKMNRKKA